MRIKISELNKIKLHIPSLLGISTKGLIDIKISYDHESPINVVATYECTSEIKNLEETNKEEHLKAVGNRIASIIK